MGLPIFKCPWLVSFISKEKALIEKNVINLSWHLKNKKRNVLSLFQRKQIRTWDIYLINIFFKVHFILVIIYFIKIVFKINIFFYNFIFHLFFLTDLILIFFFTLINFLD